MAITAEKYNQAKSIYKIYDEQPELIKELSAERKLKLKKVKNDITEFESLQQKTQFTKAYSEYSAKTGIHIDPYEKEHYYDYESLFNESGSLNPDGNGHLPSKYKKEGHPRLYKHPKLEEFSSEQKTGWLDTRLPESPEADTTITPEKYQAGKSILDVYSKRPELVQKLSPERIKKLQQVISDVDGFEAEEAELINIQDDNIAGQLGKRRAAGHDYATGRDGELATGRAVPREKPPMDYSKVDVPNPWESKSLPTSDPISELYAHHSVKKEGGYDKYKDKRDYRQEHPNQASLRAGAVRLVGGTLNTIRDLLAQHNAPMRDMERILASNPENTQGAEAFTKLMNTVNPMRAAEFALEEPVKRAFEVQAILAEPKEGDEKGLIGLYKEKRYKDLIDLSWRQTLQSAPISAMAMASTFAGAPELAFGMMAVPSYGEKLHDLENRTDIELDQGLMRTNAFYTSVAEAGSEVLGDIIGIGATKAISKVGLDVF